MAHDETAAHLAGGLPDRMPSSPRDDNYRLMQALADRFDVEESDLNQLDVLTTVQQITEENLRNQSDTLFVEAGERYDIGVNSVESFFAVEVEGELVVAGTLRTTDVSGSGEVIVSGSGEIIGTSAGEYSGLDALYELGKLMQVSPQEDESITRYRSRVMAEYSLVTCKGTIEDVLETAAAILDVNVESLRYSEPAGGEHGTVLLEIPVSAVNNLELELSELSNILNRLLAAGYRIETSVSGTFTYLSPTQYEDDAHDPELGYDGLDTNGEPKDNGGTYAGVIS